ncbi:hypothetical protein NVP1151O_36 [Vibrio phage 1.151.O._10N.222.46.B1]|nr:hypothetical protein NVP1151O_36 [Vibrio phage 1.151.O._10N.222.46.B1]
MKVAIIGGVGVGKLITISNKHGGIEILEVISSGEIDKKTNESIIEVEPISITKPKFISANGTMRKRNKSDRKKNKKERWR